MDNLSQYAFKTQTVCGCIHFLVFVVSWPIVIGFLNDFLGKDRLTFNCIPKPSDVIKQLCYGDYTSTVSPLLIPLNFAGITFGALGLFWIVFIVYGAWALRRIKREENSQLKKCLSEKFTWRFLIHVCCQLVVLGVMMGLFCHFQTLSLPEVYICSPRNTTQIPMNQGKNMTCNDLHYRQKSILNIGIITIVAISIVLCTISIIHLFLTRKDFLEQLVGDPESDDFERINLDASADGHSSASSSDREETDHIKAEGKQSSSSQPKRGAWRAKNKDAKGSKVEDDAAIFLKWCQEQLHEFYNTMSQVKITPWDPDNTVHIDEMYIQLSMRRDDRKPHGTTKEKLNDYCEIFKGHGHNLNPKRILVYGKPGIGKSTFTQKIAVDWTRGEKEILKKFDVLLLIKLRDVCDIEDFCAMLKTAELLSADEPMAATNLYEYVCQNQEKVLLVLDGYDEYSAGKSSQVYQIWKGSKLRGCCVVVTTRPVKEDELRGPSHVQFELNGFDSEWQVEQFARMLLSDYKDVNELLKYLEKQDLWGMAEIPLLLLMLCLLWKEKDRKGLPTSRADLYIRFMQTLLDHLVSKDSDEAYNSIQEYKEELSKLGELAFYALLGDCLHFNFSKLPDGGVFKKFIDVGFFQVSKVSSLNPEKIVYFLHKSVQEFLAAWFIVQELMIKKNETVTCLSKIDSLEKIEKMDEVLKFVCELSSDAARAVFSHLRIIGEKEGLTAYNFTKKPSFDDLSNDQRTFISISSDCLLCCPASDRHAVSPLFLASVDYVLILNQEQVPIAASEHLLKSAICFPNYVFFDIWYNDNKLIDDDILSIMLDLNTAVASCSGEIRTVKKYPIVLVKDFSLKKEGQQMFFYLTCIRKKKISALPTELLTELTSAPVSPPEKPVDDLSKNQDNSRALVLTENVPQQTRQHCLSFVRDIEILYPTSEDLKVVNNVLPLVTSPRKVDIQCDYGKNYDAQLIERMVSCIHFTDNLHSLRLHHIKLTAKCATDVARSLHQAPNLQKLDLSRNPLYSGVSDLAENLHHVPQLTELKLTGVNMGDKECKILAASLKDVKKLQVLALSYNPLGHGIIELAKHLNSVPDLNELTLAETQLGEEETKALAHCLKSLPELKKLDLSSNPLGHGIIELAKNLHCVPHLTWVSLSKTQMGEEEGSALARALKYVLELEWLDLRSNSLGRGVSDLSQHLSSIPELKHLLLWGVKMTKKEAEEFCTAVRGANIELFTDYHARADQRGVYRLRTEAELKHGGPGAMHEPDTLFADE
ncbi:hypothetical protein ACROYT_G016635 [Oculina patagonica]